MYCKWWRDDTRAFYDGSVESAVVCQWLPTYDVVTFYNILDYQHTRLLGLTSTHLDTYPVIRTSDWNYCETGLGLALLGRLIHH